MANGFRIESNISIILLILLIVLVSIYFFLDLKKTKMTVENLENNNNMLVKEIDNIHMRLHKFLDEIPKSILQSKDRLLKQSRFESSDQSTTMDNVSDVIEKPISAAASIARKENDMAIFEAGAHPESNEGINTNNIPVDEFIQLKKNKNNIFGEIENESTQPNNIMNDQINNNISDLLSSNNIDEDIILLSQTIPENKVQSNEDDNSNNTDTDDDSDGDSDNDSDSEISEVDDIIDDDNNNGNEGQNHMDIYMKMSVKELKEKCIEMNLKHSGNKKTLAKRIVENL